MRTKFFLNRSAIPFVVCLCLAIPALSRGDISSNAVSRLPVKEVTVFKDGHAFVVHEGTGVVSTEGQVVLDHLPAPVVGTFWAYSTDKKAKLKSVTASRKIASIERTALSLRELIEANVGAEAFITETNQSRYEATVIGFPKRSSEELASTSPPDTGDQLPQKGNLVLLKTADGTKALPIESIQNVTFKKRPALASPQEEFRNYLGLHFDWGHAQARSAGIGLMYLQKGIRWIPSYKVDIDGKSNAVVKMQATIINDMTDLSNATVHLVIGVPSFYFKETVDPIALQNTAAQLSSYFQNSPNRGASMMANNFNNAVMSQQLRVSDYQNPVPVDATSSETGPDLPPGAKNEDLYVYTLRNITLRKGERMVVAVAECSVPYEDVFSLELPFAPPPELSRNRGSQQEMDLARLVNSPKVMHKVRLKNTSKQPFTTAPALVSRDGRVISQGLMTYAAPGASTDVALTAAVDIQVKKTDSESKRTPNALVENGNHYFQVDVNGRIELMNHRAKSVEIEVKRFVLGYADSADHDGKLEMTNSFEDRDYLPSVANENIPYWWDSYSWPWWWHRVNGIGKVTWTLKLEPGKKIECGYAWHYFTQ